MVSGKIVEERYVTTELIHFVGRALFDEEGANNEDKQYEILTQEILLAGTVTEFLPF